MKIYFIPAWEKTFEISQSKRVKGDLKWVPMPTDHQSREYKRILRSEHGPSVFGAWCAIVELAARMPERGVFKEDDGPLDAEDIADETSFPVDVIEHALEFLSGPKIKWLGIKNAETLRADSEQTPSINKKSTPTVQYSTVQDSTKQEKSLLLPTHDDGDDCPSILNPVQWTFLQSMWRTGKVDRNRLPPESWFDICRRCPEFDCGNNDHTGDLLVSLRAVQGKLGPGLSRWFGTWMPKACTPEFKEEEYDPNEPF